MLIGDKVEVVADFEPLRKAHKLEYPKMGDVLTICKMEAHSKAELKEKGIFLLFFEEKPKLIGLCNKDVYGNINFKKLS